MKWTFLRLVTFFYLLMCSFSTFAMLSDAHWFSTAGIGKQFSQFDGFMTVNNNSGATPPFNQDIYTTKQHNQTILLLAAGKRFSSSNRWVPFVSFGLNYQYSLTSNIGGQVFQYSSPAFENYSYHWTLNSNVLLANAKLNFIEFHGVSPYVNAGFGGAFNLMSGYTEAPLAGVTAVRDSPDFQDQWNIKFAYQVGMGVDYQITKPMILTFGYLYQQLGKMKSGHGTSSWSSQQLNLNSLNANSIFLSMTYVFN